MTFLRNARDHVFEAVRAEVFRRDDLVTAGKLAWSCSMLGPSDAEKLSVLGKEFGEAAKEVVEIGIACSRGGSRDPTLLRKELIQIAAVCVGWIACLDGASLRVMAYRLEHEPE